MLGQRLFRCLPAAARAVTASMIAATMPCILLPAAIAQQAPVQASPDDPRGSADHAPARAGRDGAPIKADGAAQREPELGPGRLERAAAAQRALHDTIQRKFMEFDAARKEAAHNRNSARQHWHQIRGGEPVGAIAPAQGRVASRAGGQSWYSRPPLLPISKPAQAAAASGPGRPRGTRPQPVVLGGVAPIDPRKAAVLYGGSVQRRP